MLVDCWLLWVLDSNESPMLSTDGYWVSPLFFGPLEVLWVADIKGAIFSDFGGWLPTQALSMNLSQDVLGHPFFWVLADEGTARDLGQWTVETQCSQDSVARKVSRAQWGPEPNPNEKRQE